LYKIWLLHGLGPQAMTVSPSEREVAILQQTVNQAGDTVTISTVTEPTDVGADPITMLDELSLLHGLDADLVVTSTTRVAGPISQAFSTLGNVTTVTRQ
jgi:hypothetical protein